MSSLESSIEEHDRDNRSSPRWYCVLSSESFYRRHWSPVCVAADTILANFRIREVHLLHPRFAAYRGMLLNAQLHQRRSRYFVVIMSYADNYCNHETSGKINTILAQKVRVLVPTETSHRAGAYDGKNCDGIRMLITDIFAITISDRPTV